MVVDKAAGIWTSVITSIIVLVVLMVAKASTGDEGMELHIDSTGKADHSQIFRTVDEGDIEWTGGIQSVRYRREEKRVEIVQITQHDPTQTVMRATPHVIYKHIFSVEGGELRHVESIQGTYIPSRAESYSFPEVPE